MRRQAVSHLQQPSGPAEVSRLLSVSEARVWSVLMDEMSLTDEDGGRLSLLFTAAPVLRGRSGEKQMVITIIMEELHEVEGGQRHTVG